MIRIKQSDYEKIIEHAKKNLPEEACGLIAGTKTEDGADKEVKKVYLLTNIDHTNEHFSMDPKEQLAAVKDMRANGLTPLGNWHSHPESPARPSEEDKRLAYDPTVNYLILSLMNEDEPVLKAFDIDSARNVTPEEIIFID
jgi:proteasome lid subunit RPN8/RPN11